MGVGGRSGWWASLNTRLFNRTCFAYISGKLGWGDPTPCPPGSDGPTVLLLLTPFWLLTDVVASNATFSSSIGHVSYCSLLLSDCIFVIKVPMWNSITTVCNRLFHVACHVFPVEATFTLLCCIAPCVPRSSLRTC